jgi:hypothetical protein
MQIIEYPKALYLQGKHLIVANDAEEAAARDQGYDDWAADHAAHGAAAPEAQVEQEDPDPITAVPSKPKSQKGKA